MAARKTIDGIKVVKPETLVNSFNDIHKLESDTKVCFILGAGASRSSGIKTGGELARLWLNEMEENEGYEDWVKENNIDKENPAEHYSLIYEKRFETIPTHGFEYINKEMEGKDPYYGYSVLAQLLGYENHNIVITTNFDNLIEKAIYINTKYEPLICGHESLAKYAQVSKKRPLIAKIHRDKSFEPESKQEGTSKLSPEWEHNLKELIRNKIVIAIGYGGNDGSLMGLLEEADMPKKMFWCILKNETPNKGVNKLVKKLKGEYVEIEDFDVLMARLWLKLKDYLKIDAVDKTIRSVSEKRANDYGKAFVEMQEKISQSANPQLQKVSQEMLDEASDEDWWDYELKVQVAKTNDEKKKIYLEGLNKLPDSPELNGNYATFLQKTSKNYDTAKKHYKKALELEPDDADLNGNYALLLHEEGKNYDAAEKYYKKALELEPDSANKNSNYASFLKERSQDYDTSEKYFKKTLAIEPENLSYITNYIELLCEVNSTSKALDLIEKGKKFSISKNEEKYLLIISYFEYSLAKDINSQVIKNTIEDILQKGITYDSFDFESFLNSMEKQNHPKLKELNLYAKLIKGEG